MILKPQDVLVLLKLISLKNQQWSYASLAIDLSMSPSEVHACVKRGLAARLVRKKGQQLLPILANLEEFMLHGLKYVFVPETGGMQRGIPTAYAAPPLDDLFLESLEPPPVWPHPEGEVRGLSFSPLYKSAPYAAQKDDDLYELLALTDAIRGGGVREKLLAATELKKRFQVYEQEAESKFGNVAGSSGAIG